ncbi:MAG: hypothetical protein ACLP1Q_01355 [Solirubrobacteraceae bacterium]|jgi:hypothetical protein
MTWTRAPQRPLYSIALGSLLALAIATVPAYAEATPSPTAEVAVHCPRNVTALPKTGALAHAKQAALEAAPHIYRGLNVSERKVVNAYIVRKGTLRSDEAGQCGLYGRTILVEMRFPHELPSASLSQSAVYVSRIKPPGKPSKYTVWAVEH